MAIHNKFPREESNLIKIYYLHERNLNSEFPVPNADGTIESYTYFRTNFSQLTAIQNLKNATSTAEI